MITSSHLQAFSASMNESAFLSGRRMCAFDALTKSKHSLLLPDALPADDGLGAAHNAEPGLVSGLFAQFGTGDMPKGERAVFEKAYGSLVTGDDADLLRHHAFLTLGLYFRVPAGVRIDRPVILQYRNIASWASTHVVLIAEAGSRITFVERLHNDMGGEGGRSPAGDHTGEWSHVVEVIAGDGAQVEYASLQAADPGVSLSIRHRALVGSGASVAWRNATIGGNPVRHDLTSTLAGADARGSVDWIAYAKGSESYRISARNVFAARNGGGEITMKGVAEGKAHVGCDGMIEIGEGGQGTDTYLTEEVLMLDPTSRVDAVPGLEIRTNDVKASHSATVSRVTEEDLFYFGARGIPPSVARRMYIEGFLADLTGRMSVPELRKDVMDTVEAKYAAHDRR